MKILVMGAYGLLGSRLCPYLETAGYTVYRQGRAVAAEYTVNPCDPHEVHRLFKYIAPDAVINLNAMTQVDACDDRPLEAYLANARTAEVLAQVRGNTVDYILHVSTDQVYSGTGPHKEHDPKPCNVYALSKYCGELALQGQGAGILRTNFVGKSALAHRVGFTDWLFDAMSKGEPITLFDDVLFSPLHIDQTAAAIEVTLKHRPVGIFNLGSHGGISKAEFAHSFAEALGLNTDHATVGLLGDKSLTAPRPLDMRLYVSSFESTTGHTLPSTQDAILATAADYR